MRHIVSIARTKNRVINAAARIVMTIMLASSSQLASADDRQAVYAYTSHPLPLPTLTRDSLRSIFAMRLMLWPDGSRIQVFVLPDSHPVHRQFSTAVLGVFPYRLRQIWDQSVFSGTGEAPLQVDDVESMKQHLRTTPFAIGYLPLQTNEEGIYRVE